MEAGAIALCVICMLATVAAALWVRSSLPARVAQLAEQASDDAARIRAEWQTARGELESLLEAMSAEYDRLERVRRRIAASESKLKAKQAEQEGDAEHQGDNLTDYESVHRRALELGLIGPKRH